MNKIPTRWAIMIAVGALIGPNATRARADDLGPILLRTLREFGYDISWENLRGTFPGGFRAGATAVYNNTEFDFGMVRLELNGSSTLAFETSNRLGPSAEFRFSTNGQPLRYTFDINTGLQDFTAAGNILIDANTEINPLGFYDFDLFVSNRGDFESRGFAVEDGGTLDFDVGPIDVSGNVFADALAVIAEPFFIAAGQPNPFSKFSGRATRQAAIEKRVDSIKDKIAAGQELTDKDMADLIDATVVAAVFGLDTPDLTFLNQANLRALDGADAGANGLFALPSTVPEPTPLILLGLTTALWSIARRYLRRI